MQTSTIEPLDKRPVQAAQCTPNSVAGRQSRLSMWSEVSAAGGSRYLGVHPVFGKSRGHPPERRI
eukprot:9875522-Lingulodinium_polyedra.AAC.1